MTASTRRRSRTHGKVISWSDPKRGYPDVRNWDGVMCHDYMVGLVQKKHKPQVEVAAIMGVTDGNVNDHLQYGSRQVSSIALKDLPRVRDFIEHYIVTRQPLECVREGDEAQDEPPAFFGPAEALELD